MLRQALAAALTVAALAAPGEGRASSFDMLPIPGLRLQGGPLFHLDPGDDTFGSLDVLPNMQLLWFDEGLYLTPLLGYGYEGGGDGTHLFQIGVDVGLQSDMMVGVDVGLRAVLGSVDGEFDSGVRAVAGVNLWLGVFRVEAAYQ